MARSEATLFCRRRPVRGPGRGICLPFRFGLAFALLLAAARPAIADRLLGNPVGISADGAPFFKPIVPHLSGLSALAGDAGAVPFNGPIAKIVGGAAVPSQTTYPWMALIIDQVRGYMCGGTLIAPNVLLTAAHCAAGSQPSFWSVRTYRLDQSKSTQTEGGIDYSVTRVEIHPSYNANSMVFDVAVFFLSAPVNYGSFVPAFVAINRNGAMPTAGETARTIGWGTTSYQGSTPNIMREVDIPAASPATCVSVLGQGFDNPTYLCAGSVGKDSCQGDSGGPILVFRNGAWLQVGIVSFGTAGCADSTEYLGIYSRISSFSDWIDARLAEAGAVTQAPVKTTTRRPVTTTTTLTRTTAAVPAGETVVCASPVAALTDRNSVVSSINIPGQGILQEVKVELDLQHSFFTDLVINLTRVSDGRTVQLYNHNTGCSSFASSRPSLVFDDAAADQWGANCATASFRPDSPLAALQGGGSGGQWTLRVADEWDGDSGILYGWCLRLRAEAGFIQEPSTVTVTSTTTFVQVVPTTVTLFAVSTKTVQKTVSRTKTVTSFRTTTTRFATKFVTKCTSTRKITVLRTRTVTVLRAAAAPQRAVRLGQAVEE
ncbi:trypsin-like cysteine/serine peptidase domain-containing protein [Hyaloraphidium curvatum]|nr:trypsin-like cysteine/serine peptidase domain-containing protein [Hyaloraphidium curvatum]